MAEIDTEASDYVRNILKRQTDRDKQYRVGASQISNECTKCLAEAMATGANHQSKYNAGAVIGTAIHAYLEERNQDPNALKEYKGMIDVIPGYGEIRSTTDLYVADKKLVLDFKTTTREKLAKYIRDWEHERPNTTVDRYWRQAQLYAYMLEAPVERVALCFIARDAQIIDRDVVAISMPYQERIAVNAMNRAKKIWRYIEGGGDWRDLNSHEDCYVCSQVRPLLDADELEL